MARYIDANELDNEVMHLFIAITGNPKQHTVVNECKSSFRRMIEEQPTADVAPVVHGEWIDFDIDYGGIPAVAYQCSECRKSNGFITDFCPNCGAKMDGKENEDEV